MRNQLGKPGSSGSRANFRGTVSLKPSVALPIAVRRRNSATSVSKMTGLPPSLVGAWDVWPMLLSASAGFSVVGTGADAHLEATDRQPIRAVLERYSDRTHGDAQTLSPDARADLEAFVMSL